MRSRRYLPSAGSRAPRRGGVDPRDDRGTAAIEFALVLPFLVLLLLGIVEFGMMFGDQLALTHAAREGARLASVGKYDAATVIARAYPVTPTITTVPNPVSAAKRGESVTVTLAYEYDWTFLNFPELPIIGPLVFNNEPLMLSGSATMRRE